MYQYINTVRKAGLGIVYIFYCLTSSYLQEVLSRCFVNLPLVEIGFIIFHYYEWNTITIIHWYLMGRIYNMPPTVLVFFYSNKAKGRLLTSPHWNKWKKVENLNVNLIKSKHCGQLTEPSHQLNSNRLPLCICCPYGVCVSAAPGPCVLH